MSAASCATFAQSSDVCVMAIYNFITNNTSPVPRHMNRYTRTREYPSTCQQFSSLKSKQKKKTAENPNQPQHFQMWGIFVLNKTMLLPLNSIYTSAPPTHAIMLPKRIALISYWWKLPCPAANETTLFTCLWARGSAEQRLGCGEKMPRDKQQTQHQENYILYCLIHCSFSHTVEKDVQASNPAIKEPHPLKDIQNIQFSTLWPKYVI